MSELREIETKLGAARTRLILEKPFIGSLTLHLPLVAAGPAWCETVATDARAIYFNPEYVASLSLAQTQFVLAHEAMHCALGHFARRSHRTRRRWDIACDHAANLLLADEGLRPPPGALLNPEFRGLSAEEIYPLLPPESAETTLDRHLFEEHVVIGDKNAGTARTRHGALEDAVLRAEAGPAAREELARRWQGRMASAAQQARQAGRLSESWLRLVDNLIQPQLPWRALLARYLMGLARDDYSFQRPSRREGAALLPGLAGGEVDLHVALDTSGSVGEEDLAQFAAEIDALKGQLRARVTLLACDERLDSRGPWVFEPWEPISIPRELGGGGGTSFLPVFEWMAGRCLRPDALLYFTDAEGEFPRRAPDFPVIWLVKGRSKVPWGERIQLN